MLPFGLSNEPTKRPTVNERNVSRRSVSNPAEIDFVISPRGFRVSPRRPSIPRKVRRARPERQKSRSRDLARQFRFRRLKVSFSVPLLLLLYPAVPGQVGGIRSRSGPACPVPPAIARIMKGSIVWICTKRRNKIRRRRSASKGVRFTWRAERLRARSNLSILAIEKFQVLPCVLYPSTPSLSLSPLYCFCAP